MDNIKWLSDTEKNVEYGYLTILDNDIEKTKKEHRLNVITKCRCGYICTKSYHNIKNGGTKTCGRQECEWKQKLSEESRRKTNTYDLTQNYGIGYTNKGQVFYFDLEDYDKISPYTWYLDSKGYVRANIFNRKTNSRDYLFMHDFIMNINHNMITNVDHIGGCDTTNDNRKCNLRIVTTRQNNLNQKNRKDNTSGVKGVNWCKERHKWISRISINNKRIYIGAFDNFEDAVNIRKEYEEKYHSLYSYDNSQKSFKAVDNEFLAKYH